MEPSNQVGLDSQGGNPGRGRDGVYPLQTRNCRIFHGCFSGMEYGEGTLNQEEVYAASMYRQQAGVDISKEGVYTFHHVIDEDDRGEIDQDE
eukprot:scaffold8265_cov172-Skeletonema_marinoi.AAC.7